MKNHWIRRVASGLSPHVDEIRIRLARPDALLLMAILGAITGLLAALVILAFQALVVALQSRLLPGGDVENFEGLAVWERLLLPVAAAVFLAIMFRWFARGISVLGVARVLERMLRHQGRCTPRAFLLQFFGAAAAIVGGHSVGREGPHVFLGAASGSLLGQALHLPNNALRTLLACGVAAGIAASFNTPLAGVVFAIEVIMMEYRVASFIPVILAAVSATVLVNHFAGDLPVFVIPPIPGVAIGDLWVVLLIGLAAGAVSALFIHAIQGLAVGARDIPIWWRMLLAGVLVGAIGIWVPEVMGIGYDSVTLALQGRYALAFLGVLLFAKLLATALCIGLGVPGGMIGPSLFIGAILGALIGELAVLVAWAEPGQVGLFALLGMGAVMAGSLQAPLAALTAMLELTDSAAVIMPGMLVVAVAGLTASQVFGKDSLFLSMLRAAGVECPPNHAIQALCRVGVASVMERSVVRLGSRVDRGTLGVALMQEPVYLVVTGIGTDAQVLLSAADTRHYLDMTADQAEATVLDLAQMPVERWQLADIGLHANLHEAHERLSESGAEALLVVRHAVGRDTRVYGVVLAESIEVAADRA